MGPVKIKVDLDRQTGRNEWKRAVEASAAMTQSRTLWVMSQARH